MKLLFKGSLYEAKNYLKLNELVEKYKNIPNSFITFRSINKVGINPNTKWNTPIGIYAYNLSNTSDFPYTGCKYEKHCYAYILAAKENTKKLDLKSYTKKQFENDLIKLKNNNLLNEIEYNKYFKKYLTENEINYDELEQSLNSLQDVKKYGKIIYQILQSISTSNSNMSKNIINLGYDYVEDSGEGIIHENEPYQVVFVNPKSYVIVEYTILY